MGQFSLSLSWDSYKHSICSGLSVLQQNGELVDMTLAADGHHVKVHQLVMSLVSPYIKDLIASANCPHPIIFLNKISYTTLRLILEYIYTGEVVVTHDDLPDFVEASKELHIKGLEDMNLEVPGKGHEISTTLVTGNEGRPLSERGHFNRKGEQIKNNDSAGSPQFTVSQVRTTQQKEENESYNGDSHGDDDVDFSIDNQMNTDNENDDSKIRKKKSKEDDSKKIDASINYSISNQGVLQMILNRCIFKLEYTSMDGQHRKWRCVDYRSIKCPASIITRDGIVTKRYGAHSHPFHDNKILKKVRDNGVFAAITEAEAKGKMKKQRTEAEKPAK